MKRSSSKNQTIIENKRRRGCFCESRRKAKGERKRTIKTDTQDASNRCIKQNKNDDDDSKTDLVPTAPPPAARGVRARRHQIHCSLSFLL